MNTYIKGFEFSLYSKNLNLLWIRKVQVRILRIKQNYPNPFNPKTNIEFTIPKVNFVSLKIYDVLGSEVITLLNEE